MTRTRPLALVLLVALGSGLTWFLETALAASGRAIAIPPITLAIALLLIGVFVVAMALPVRRVSRRVPHARIDPFYAIRVVTLAKASSVSGALLAGGAAGILAFLLSRSASPVAGSVTATVLTGVGALLLLVAGLVAEHMCVIPPDDDPKPGRSGPDRVGLS